jgi:hypothetical protein
MDYTMYGFLGSLCEVYRLHLAGRHVSLGKCSIRGTLL